MPFQKHILPDSNEVWLTQQTTAPDGTVTEAKLRYVLDGPPEPFGQLVKDGQERNEAQEQTSYRIERIDSSYSMLSSKAKTAYRASQICMVLLPLMFAVIGITLCAWWFYHKILEPPITVLMDATTHIQDQDLNFQINFDGRDELGQLCTAFEKMRQTLYENNRQMWSMLEERRALQASVAHDLRNPIAIMTGYVEYLQENRQGGTLTDEKLEKALTNLGITAERMGRYTDTMRDLGAIEETEVHRREVELPDFLQHMADSLSILFQNIEVRFACDFHVPEGRAVLDGELLYRVLENLISNALRFAEHQIELAYSSARKIPVFSSSRVALSTSEGSAQNSPCKAVASSRRIAEMSLILAFMLSWAVCSFSLASSKSAWARADWAAYSGVTLPLLRWGYFLTFVSAYFSAVSAA